jgi:hypothetical protein
VLAGDKTSALKIVSSIRPDILSKQANALLLKRYQKVDAMIAERLAAEMKKNAAALKVALAEEEQLIASNSGSQTIADSNATQVTSLSLANTWCYNEQYVREHNIAEMCERQLKEDADADFRVAAVLKLGAVAIVTGLVFGVVKLVQYCNKDPKNCDSDDDGNGGGGGGKDPYQYINYDGTLNIDGQRWTGGGFYGPNGMGFVLNPSFLDPADAKKYSRAAPQAVQSTVSIGESLLRVASKISEFEVKMITTALTITVGIVIGVLTLGGSGSYQY